MNIAIAAPSQGWRATPMQAARAWLQHSGAAALATVVSTWGSAPVPVGGQLVIGADGRFEGSVSGGCVEAAVIAEAADVIAADKPKLLAFGVEDETAWGFGLPCGGTIQILLEPLRLERDRPYLDARLAAEAGRKPLHVLTDVDSGERRFASELSLMPELAEIGADGQSRLVELPQGRLFLHALLPPLRLVVTGATHIGQYLSRLAATLGYEVAVVDPRSAFSSPERFGETTLLTDWPETALAALGLDARTALVVLSHIADLDDEALRAALRSDCLYIGALGSRRSHAARLERLRAEGFSGRDLARIRGPVGLPIGAIGPSEIAVSILAEIVKVVRGQA